MSGISVPKESRVKYLNRRAEEVQKIKTSLEGSPDWELIKKVGHQMKGNAATFGFSELAFYGKRLEDSAQNQNAEDLRKTIAKFEEQVTELLGSLIADENNGL